MAHLVNASDDGVGHGRKSALHLLQQILNENGQVLCALLSGIAVVDAV
eukprot:CAMPEP_0174719808 /NCGR_PEP_ID=MMETSP1094-20130205/32017_1 /TAXON_ID=156173 /ORGANISM="Chrysochromulina brevifilum, Strain UTEX LB 985" /LENGTH=47 /DNA_ID= /DNA_START= /DNA_END= /DNA_ORIENTATION=